METATTPMNTAMSCGLSTRRRMMVSAFQLQLTDDDAREDGDGQPGCNIQSRHTPAEQTVQHDDRHLVDRGRGDEKGSG